MDLTLGELSCRCVRCKVERPMELCHESEGGRLLPLLCHSEDGVIYTAETAAPCDCSERRVTIRLVWPRDSHRYRGGGR